MQTEIKLLTGNCLDIMRRATLNSVDAIVTDPPYGLSFMGKKWDYDVPSVEIWKEAYRVLKPGGYLLAFAGTRTQHRMAVNIEDAGFEIRDMIAWVYGSGFPKSLNIGKAVDKLQGNERVITKIRTDGNKGGGANTYDDDNYVWDKPFEETKGTSEWEGWGTSLKPALEPITVARKPIEGTVAENCLKWGVGGINIDVSRVSTTDSYSYPNGAGGNGFHGGVGGEPDGSRTEATQSNSLGRFPANLIHDGSEEVVGLFPDLGKAGNARNSLRKDNYNNSSYSITGKVADIGYNDSGSAARFFYCPKSSKSERNRGCEGMEEVAKPLMGEFKNNPGRETPKSSPTPRANHHPTVKPIALMEYLVKLVSREGHIVLDPFMGSGTTGIACKNLNRKFIGIEMSPEYMEIARNRINAN